MPAAPRVPDATIHRLSMYHCHLGEILRVGGPVRVTSRQLAQDLGLKEESVRRDLSFVGGVGRRGTGYEVDILFDALQAFLGLSEEYPIVKVGTAQMLEALDVVFPSSSYGVHPVACFSEITEDVGKSVHGVEVRHLSEIPQLDRELGVHVALVATSPEHVSPTLGLLAQAGITGVLL
ncbi:MAG: hypothetical protein HY876_00750, partial [Coriobacteriales bacterium]|nr:hypothetical protein [Coriobacteriales bacterium]